MLEKVIKFIKHNSLYNPSEIKEAFSFLRQVELEYSNVLRTGSHQESINRAKKVDLESLMKPYEFNYELLKKVDLKSADKLKLKLNVIEVLSNSTYPKGYSKQIIYSPALDIQ